MQSSLESELLRIRATITHSSIFSQVCMIEASSFVAVNINVILTCRLNHFVVTIAITGDFHLELPDCEF